MTDNFVKHTGTPRHSGRYPWGSGKDPEQRNKSLRGYVKSLKEKGISDLEIAKGLEMKTTELRQLKSIEKDAKKAADSAFAFRLHEKGLSNVAIGKRMGINESSVRSLLNPSLQERSKILRNTADVLKKRADESRYIDVGLGTEIHLGVSRTKLQTAVKMLEEEGYKVHYLRKEQLGTGKKTSYMVLTPPDVEYKEVAANYDKIKLIRDYSENGGKNWYDLEPINNVSSDRIYVKHKGEGGELKDGVIELRRGVDDISLGEKKYAQVRIGVDGTHYMKGMAIYSDDIPNGYDIVYNSNKDRGAPKDKIFKPMETDPDNPFGSIVRQKHYIDADGKEKLSALNLIAEEGKWEEWRNTISSQVLSKQSPSLAKKQLGEDAKKRQQEFDDLNSLTNPAVKKRLLNTFADNCDKAAVDLKAAAMPRQGSHVLLPFTSVNENEIYAPDFKNGESVVLIRHPHGGIFEIPQLRVNNNNEEAIRIIGKDAKDAVGINPKVASKLSGADFDGDSVLVIPNDKGEIRTSPSLKALKDFDPKEAYPYYEGMKVMSTHLKEQKMGDVSNLITDMTIKAADNDEIARAVRHSMVVIDAAKHKLNYKQSYIDNNIAALKTKYQGGPTRGASTLISRAGSEVRVPERKDWKSVNKSNTDPITGRKIYTLTGETYEVPTGPYRKDPITGKKIYLTNETKVMGKTTLTTKMAKEEDARALSSGTKMESIYADYANEMKALANESRKKILNTPDMHYSPAAKVAYAKEVESLNAKLNLAYDSKPFERHAQLIANSRVATKKAANPNLKPGDIKKLKGQALQAARAETGHRKQPVVITDREWEAIQAGAITNSKLNSILLNTDLDALKQRAMPRERKAVSDATLTRAKIMRSSGKYTNAEIADALGVSISTLSTALEGKES
jgi:DNA-binding CsgD family transcriptional regulator